MLLNYAALIAGLHCLSAVAMPSSSSTIEGHNDPEPGVFPLAPSGVDSIRTAEELKAYFDQLGAVRTVPERPTSTLDTRGDAAATPGLYPGKVYKIAGWVLSVGSVVVEQFGGTSPPNLKLPRSSLGASTLANLITDSVLGTIGGGRASKSVNEWSWAGQWFDSHYEFSGIPRALMYTIVYEGIMASTDWITDDNAFDVILHDAGGGALLQFSVGPKVKGTILRYYDEL
ncbi:hypothetical protein NQ176_g4536 [Zarea fungicola]|uniref:Uncharacterized protein n=1 Tax=Zarea fungicola TaxID=93591 RepID=A0ACC1NE82_9HYPO|nr:hypothetical protein NQ176_g4536 [Lecanicillium fungicola]